MNARQMARLLHAKLSSGEFYALQGILDESQYGLWLELTRILRRERPELFKDGEFDHRHTPLTLCTVCRKVHYKIGSTLIHNGQYIKVCSVQCCKRRIRELSHAQEDARQELQDQILNVEIPT